MRVLICYTPRVDAGECENSFIYHALRLEASKESIPTHTVVLDDEKQAGFADYEAAQIADCFVSEGIKRVCFCGIGYSLTTRKFLQACLYHSQIEIRNCVPRGVFAHRVVKWFGNMPKKSYGLAVTHDDRVIV